MFRTAIRQGLLGAVLPVAVALVSLPAAAESETLKDDEPLTMAEASVSALTKAMETAPSLVWPDAPAPDSLAGHVPAARQFLWDNAIDWLPWPLHLRFVEARCNGEGKVALVFEELRPLFPWRTYAVAWRGSTPTSLDDGWGGGTGMTSVLDDPEFVHIMGTDTYACP